MILFSHPTGNVTAREAAMALHEAGLLQEYWTSVPHPLGAMLRRWLPERFARGRAGPDLPAALAGRVRAILRRNHASCVGLRRGWSSVWRPDPNATAQALDRRTAERLRSADFKGVYGFAGGAEDLFATAEQQGLARIYDLPGGYGRAAARALAQEAARWPEWPAPRPLFPNAEDEDRIESELARAELVLVPSTFALNSLDTAAGFTGSAVLLPYGVTSCRAPLPLALSGGPTARLRVLFVGTLGVRQGLPDLLAACARLGRHVELTMIGRRPSHLRAEVERRLAAHRWIPRCGLDRLREEIGRHDVLVLPSLWTGFGHVLLEAMAAGRPVIATPHTAAPDLVEDGVEGFIVPVRQPEELATRLELLRADPERRREMGEAAWRRARAHGWESYRQNLVACVSALLASR